MLLASASLSNQPTNALFINLLNPDQPYIAGSRVRGTVRVDPKIKPTQINLDFRGYSVIHNKNASGVQVDLFKQSQDLFLSTGAGENFDILRKGTQKDGKVELPFEFTFPRNVEIPPPSDRIWSHSADSYNHPKFQHSAGFPIPPTSTPSTTADNPLTPRIVYLLEARMESSLPDGPVKIRQDLTYIPPAPEYDPMLLQPDLNFGSTLPKHMCHYKLFRTRKLYPDYKSRSKASKLRDKLVDKELFFGLETTGEIPYAKINYFASPARVLILGAPIPIVMTVQHLERSQSLVEPPAIFIRRVRVQLLHTFSIFVPNLLSSSLRSKEHIDYARDTTILMDKKFEMSDGKLLLDGLKLSDLGEMTLARGKYNILPSFTSYGLALEYEIQVDIWGECADREFSGLACKERVQVVTDYQVETPQSLTSFYAPGPEYQEVDPMRNATASVNPPRLTEFPPTNPFADNWTPPTLVSPPISRPAVPPPPYQRV